MKDKRDPGMKKLEALARRFGLVVQQVVPREEVGIKVPMIIVEQGKGKDSAVIGAFDDGLIYMTNPIDGVPSVDVSERESWEEKAPLSYVLDYKALEMQELLTLAELFPEIEVLEERKDSHPYPYLLVRGKDGNEERIAKRGDTFDATGRIPNVPMQFIGDGGWNFMISI